MTGSGSAVVGVFESKEEAENFTLLEDKNIPWCYCEMFNLFPKHLVILYGNESQWTNATEEDITYTLKDGSEVTLKVCKELLDVFCEYTLK